MPNNKGKYTPAPAKAKRDPNEARKLAELGPNKKYPYAVKLVEPDGHVTFERFATRKERDTRQITLSASRLLTVTAINYPGAKA